MHPPVWLFISGWTAYDVSTHVFISNRLSAPSLVTSSKVPLRYWRTHFNFFQSWTSGSATLLHRNAMARRMSTRARWVTYNSFATIQWNLSANLGLSFSSVSLVSKRYLYNKSIHVSLKVSSSDVSYGNITSFDGRRDQDEHGGIIWHSGWGNLFLPVVAALASAISTRSAFEYPITLLLEYGDFSQCISLLLFREAWRVHRFENVKIFQLIHNGLTWPPDVTSSVWNGLEWLSGQEVRNIGDSNL